MGKKGSKSSEKKPITQIKTGTIIKLFDKTADDGDVYCPHFWELKYANGCKYDCQWCYLNGTFRYSPVPKAPRLKDGRVIESDTRHGLEKIETRTLFNAGEVSDGLLYPSALSRHVIPLFKDKHINKVGHKLLIVTKDTETTLMSYSNAPGHIIFSYSINAEAVSKQYELRAPHPWDRLRASQRAVDYGYETRLRIDPMVPIHRWDIAYGMLADRIMRINPWATVITLGSLRGLQSTITAAKRLGNDTSWADYLKEKSDWGLRVPTGTRVNMYQFIVDELRNRGFAGHIALCKETHDVWAALGLDKSKTKCNCML